MFTMSDVICLDRKTYLLYTCKLNDFTSKYVISIDMQWPMDDSDVLKTHVYKIN